MHNRCVTGRPLKPWHFVLVFGVVSLLADMVYEGARSIIGPYLATLGASAAVVGLVAGAGEFIGYGLRVVAGYAVARTQRYWTWTITGYALTVLSVPLIGVTGSLVPALLLYGTERLGEAVRSPAKDTLLSHASTSTGRGSAFGVHQALDQTGAPSPRPLLLAAVLSAHAGDATGWRSDTDRSGRARPDPAGLAPLSRSRSAELREGIREATESDAAGPALPKRLPARFWHYVITIGVLSCGVASFPLLAFHAQRTGLLSDAQVPVLFAVAMAVDGAAGLVMGRVYDKREPVTLVAVPIAAALSTIAFTGDRTLVWIGVAVWGIVSRSSTPP